MSVIASLSRDDVSESRGLRWGNIDLHFDEGRGRIVVSLLGGRRLARSLLLAAVPVADLVKLPPNAEDAGRSGASPVAGVKSGAELAGAASPGGAEPVHQPCASRLGSLSARDEGRSYLRLPRVPDHRGIVRDIVGDGIHALIGGSRSKEPIYHLSQPRFTVFGSAQIAALEPRGMEVDLHSAKTALAGHFFREQTLAHDEIDGDGMSDRAARVNRPAPNRVGDAASGFVTLAGSQGGPVWHVGSRDRSRSIEVLPENGEPARIAAAAQQAAGDGLTDLIARRYEDRFGLPLAADDYAVFGRASAEPVDLSDFKAGLALAAGAAAETRGDSHGAGVGERVEIDGDGHHDVALNWRHAAWEEGRMRAGFTVFGDAALGGGPDPVPESIGLGHNAGSASQTPVSFAEHAARSEADGGAVPRVVTLHSGRDASRGVGHGYAAPTEIDFGRIGRSADARKKREANAEQFMPIGDVAGDGMAHLARVDAPNAVARRSVKGRNVLFATSAETDRQSAGNRAKPDRAFLHNLVRLTRKFSADRDGANMQGDGFDSRVFDGNRIVRGFSDLGARYTVFGKSGAVKMCLPAVALGV
ncbi:MAG: hypothetical protein AAF503_03280 [Pseudomonadota bacterium]